MGFRTLLAALLVFTSLSSAASQNIVVNVSMPDSTTVSDRQVLVDVVFTNVGESSIRMVNWFLPDGELDADMFLMSRNGEPVMYLGPVVKRAAPSAQDMITLAPGESISRSVDLASAYDLSRSGEYSIQYAVASTHLFAPAHALKPCGGMPRRP